MKTITEILRDADPLLHESMTSSERDYQRQAILRQVPEHTTVPEQGHRQNHSPRYARPNRDCDRLTRRTCEVTTRQRCVCGGGTL